MPAIIRALALFCQLCLCCETGVLLMHEDRQRAFPTESPVGSPPQNGDGLRTKDQRWFKAVLSKRSA